MASKRNGTLYIGITSNPQRRIYEHKNDLVEGFTKKYQLQLLVHLEMLNDSSGLEKTKNELLGIKDVLGGPGASKRVADIALNMLEKLKTNDKIKRQT